MDIKITMADNNSNRMVKHSGQVFTPDFLVISILDYAGYFLLYI